MITTIAISLVILTAIATVHLTRKVMAERAERDRDVMVLKTSLKIHDHPQFQEVFQRLKKLEEGQASHVDDINLLFEGTGLKRPL